MPATSPAAARPRPNTNAGTHAPDVGALRPRAAALRIGDLAARAGVSADTLRYYERRGLLPPSARRASGYREYPPDAVRLVRFIKQTQALGFALSEVEELIRLRGAAGRRGARLEARDVAAAKIRDIDDRVRQLGALRAALAGLVAECERTCGPDGEADDAPDCPIIAALNDEARDVGPAAAPGSARPETDR